MLIKDLMIKPPPAVSPEATAGEVLRTLREKKADMVAVVDSGGKLEGVIGALDLIKAMVPPAVQMAEGLAGALQEKAFDELAAALLIKKAGDIKRDAKDTVDAESNLVEACERILLHTIRNLPVLSDGKLVGIIGTAEIFKAVAAKESKKRKE